MTPVRDDSVYDLFADASTGLPPGSFTIAKALFSAVTDDGQPVNTHSEGGQIDRSYRFLSEPVRTLPFPEDHPPTAREKRLFYTVVDEVSDMENSFTRDDAACVALIWILGLRMVPSPHQDELYESLLENDGHSLEAANIAVSAAGEISGDYEAERNAILNLFEAFDVTTEQMDAFHDRFIA